MRPRSPLFRTEAPWAALRSHWYAPTGQTLRITKIDGTARRALEIDGKPAAKRYAELLGVGVDDLEFGKPKGFAVQPDGAAGRARVLHPRAVEAARRRLDPVREHARGGLASSSSSRSTDIVESTRRFFETELPARVPSPRAALLFHCSGRKWYAESHRQARGARRRTFRAAPPCVGLNVHFEIYCGFHINTTLTALGVRSVDVTRATRRRASRSCSPRTRGCATSSRSRRSTPRARSRASSSARCSWRSRASRTRTSIGSPAELARSKKVEEERAREIEAAARLKSEFLANFSHEIRTPLNAIIGYCDLLMRDEGTRLTPHGRRDLSVIKANAKTLLALINDILDLSKIEAGRAEVVKEIVDLGELAEECLATVREILKGKDVALNADLVGPPESSPIR